jgi:hypothetical protein
MTRPFVDRIAVVLAVMGTGYLCYTLAAWGGFVPGETLSPRDALLGGSIALLAITPALEERSPRARVAVSVASGIALVVYVWARFA